MARAKSLLGAATAAAIALTAAMPTSAQSPNDYDKQLLDAIKRKDKVRVRTLIRHPSIDKEGGYPAGTSPNPERAYEYWLSLAVTHTAPRDGIFELLVQNGALIENPPAYMSSCNALPLNRAAGQTASGNERGWIEHLATVDAKVLGPDPWLCTSPCKYLASTGSPDVNEPSWRFGSVVRLVNGTGTVGNDARYNAVIAAALKRTPDLSKTFDGSTAPDCFGNYPLLLQARTLEVRQMLLERKAHLYGHPVDGAGWSIAHWAAGWAQSGRSSSRPVDMPAHYLSNMRYLRDVVAPKDPATGYSRYFLEAMLARNKVGVTPETMLQVSTFHMSPPPQTGWAKLPPATNMANRNEMRKFLIDSYTVIRAKGHVVPDSQMQCLPPNRPGNVSECIVGVDWRNR